MSDREASLGRVRRFVFVCVCPVVISNSVEKEKEEEKTAMDKNEGIKCNLVNKDMETNHI